MFEARRRALMMPRYASLLTLMESLSATPILLLRRYAAVAAKIYHCFLMSLPIIA